MGSIFFKTYDSGNTWENIGIPFEDELTKVFDYVDENIIKNILKSPNAEHTESHLSILWQCISYEMWRNRLRQL